MGRSGPGRIIAIVFTLVVVALITWVLYVLFVDAADTPMSQLSPMSDVGDTQHAVYKLVFWLAAGVFVFIMALTLAFALIFREREGVQAMQFHGNARLEVLWTLIPVAIVAVIAVPTFQAIIDTHGDAPDGAMEVIAVGHQWWFEFEYPELGITTANELHLPVDRPVNITLRSSDVIHSFYVPRLAGKVDMVPGHDNHTWFTPREASDEPYLAQCYEFCGTAHANMRFRVFVQTEDDFQAWVTRMQDGEPAPISDLAQAGEQQFTASGCIGCHAIEGNDAAIGRIGPDLTNFHERTTLGAGILDNTPENLTRWIADPQRVKPGNLMPRLPLNEEQLAAVVAYLLEQPE